MKKRKGFLKFLFGWRLIFAVIYLVGFTVVKNADTGVRIAESGRKNIPAAVSTQIGQDEKNARRVFNNVTVIERESFEAEINALIEETYKGLRDK